jgi:hypothetical protein
VINFRIQQSALEPLQVDDASIEGYACPAPQEDVQSQLQSSCRWRQFEGHADLALTGVQSLSFRALVDGASLKAMPTLLFLESSLSASEPLQLDDTSIEGHAALPHRKESSPLCFRATAGR